METKELHSILTKPENISPKHSAALEELLEEFPYFQAARVAYLKSLYIQNSFKYNTALQKTASYTADREILFDFITSDTFASYKPIDFTSVSDEKEPVEEDKLLNSLVQSISEIDKGLSKEEESIQRKEELEKRLQVGSPLKFSTKEHHSFQEWLQLSKKKVIDRNENKSKKKDPSSKERQNKFELIDRFIKENPRITPTKNTPVSPVNIDNSTQDDSSIMTETLAKIYLEQKKYQKAIQAYEILILKYPEKSSLFADRISYIKELQQYHNL